LGGGGTEISKLKMVAVPIIWKMTSQEKLDII
jgi:hypothetical protein